MKKTIALAAAGVLGLGIASAQEDDLGWFERFDTSNDQYIETTEFKAGTFDRFDDNDDLVISQDEFDNATSLFYDGDYDQSYSDFDADGDSNIDSQEFMNTYGTDRFDSWEADDDNDDRISEDEFSQGLFGVADDNGDGNVSQDELNANSDLFSESVQFDDLDTDGNGDISTEEFNEQL